MSTYELAGKVLLITGAARGIGFETARIAHGRGASVVLVDLDQASADEAAAKLGSRALALAADVVDLEAMEQAVSDSVDHFGKVDVVIANAGITPLKTTARAIDADDWEKVVEVNVMGVWRTIRAGLPEIKRNGGQAVIISSSYAHVNGIFNSSYAVSKAAVEALGRALQIDEDQPIRPVVPNGLADHGYALGSLLGRIDLELPGALVVAGFVQGDDALGSHGEIDQRAAQHIARGRFVHDQQDSASRTVTHAYPAWGKR